MINEYDLGRYECTEEGHNKYWHIIFERSTQQYVAYWGRIGTKGQSIVYDEKKAKQRIKEKVKKGYVRKDRFETSVGSQALNYFLNED